MSVVAIRKDGDPILRLVARALESDQFDDALNELRANLIDTMESHHALGLSAPQIGVSQRVIVVDVAVQPGHARPLVMVNPVVTKAKDFQRSGEGCLSVDRKRWGEVVLRRKHITVEFYDPDGEPRRLQARNQFAAVIQHEIDHLDGKLYTDYVRPRQPPPFNGGYHDR